MTLANRCRRIGMLCVDVDGVLSPGDIVYAQASGMFQRSDCGEEKAFHVRDGSGFKRWHNAGKHSAIVTGRQSAMVSVRARETGIAHVLQGCRDKVESLEGLLADLKVELSEVCFVGDDVIDVGVMERVGLAVAVADACVEARQSAHYITRQPGGRGAVREVIELILRCQGTW
ncbi:MAG: hypothetical protein EBV06_12135 [Planctomycetia bacterium]|nr:hypothetical protein [Planctomycetia bacterium]